MCYLPTAPCLDHGDLDAGEDLHSELAAALRGLGHARHLVVVGQCEQVDSRRVGPLCDGARCEHPVGQRRVDVEVAA